MPRKRTQAEADPLHAQEVARQSIRAALGLLSHAMHLQDQGQSQSQGGYTRDTLWTCNAVVYVIRETLNAQGKLQRAVVVDRYDIPMAWGADLYGSHDGQGRWIEDKDAVELEWGVEP